MTEHSQIASLQKSLGLLSLSTGTQMELIDFEADHEYVYKSQVEGLLWASYLRHLQLSRFSIYTVDFSGADKIA